MFIQWIDDYSEMHFKVIRWIYKNPGCTRKDIWMGVHGAVVREDSAEADLFKLLMRDLSTGSVIRQHNSALFMTFPLLMVTTIFVSEERGD